MYILGIWASSRRVEAALQAIALTLSVTPTIKVLSWSASGFGTAYANPASPIATFASAKQVRFSPANDVIVIPTGGYNFPDIYAYAWSSATGFGTKYTSPVGLPVDGDAISAAFSPAGTDIAFGIEKSPYNLVYPWSSVTGFGTKYANPATMTAHFGEQNSIGFINTAIVFSGYNNNYKIVGYPWTTGVGFGTKYSDPSVTGDDSDRGIKFGSLGTSIIRANSGSSSSTRQNAYPFNPATGFGTRYSDPATALTMNPGSMAVNTAGNVVVFSQSSNLSAYQWSPGYGTKFADPATLPLSSSDAISFNSLDDAIARVGFRTSNIQVEAYAWNNVTGFGTKFAAPSPSFLGNGRAVSFTN